jgi:hypothetical protein
VLEEVLRMVLEIINSCLSHQLAHNPNLVYTLLYKKHVFEPFRTHPAFQDIVQNVDAVSLATHTALSVKPFYYQVQLRKAADIQFFKRTVLIGTPAKQ